MATKISQITAREILDSQGWPTVAATVILENGLSGTASVPAGSGLLNDEAQEKRDDNREYYHGRGVTLAIENIERRLAPELIGLSPLKQAEIDQRLITLDGSANKENLGANAILAVSLAVARAAAASQKQPLYRYLNETYFKEVAPSLPAPIITLFNGGCYADTNLDFQEYSLVLNPAASRFQKKKRASFAAMLRAGTEIYHSLGELLNESGYDTDTGSEGGFAPDMDSSIQAMELIMAAALSAGYDPHQEARLGINIGAAALYDELNHNYIFSLDSNHFTDASLLGLYHEWLHRFPLAYLEDPIAPEDRDGWREISAALGSKLILAGKGLFLTNARRLATAAEDEIANAIVIIPGQVGTLTETIACLKLASEKNYQTIISQRRGETNDDFIADLAVAAGADYFKGGAPTRGERVAKWNRLAALEQELYGSNK